jgi:hypothetical protein
MSIWCYSTLYAVLDPTLLHVERSSELVQMLDPWRRVVTLLLCRHAADRHRLG